MFYQYIFFDKNPWIIKVVEVIFPRKHHAYCLRHLVDNFVRQLHILCYMFVFVFLQHSFNPLASIHMNMLFLSTICFLWLGDAKISEEQ